MRMRLPGAELEDRRPRGPAPSLHSLANGQAGPAGLGRDAQIGHIFCNMRSAMRLPREAIARRLATTPATIEDLESGAVSSLPHWRETSRIVRSYCELLRLDPQPILWRMQSQMGAAGAYDDDPPTQSSATRSPGPPALLRKDAARSAPAPRKRRRARRMFALSAPLALAAVAFYLAQAAPAPLYRAIGLLPAPIAGTARAGMDNLVLYSAPRRDGLRWIDVGDPQLRKVDKLQTSTR
jgi:hypothetical protein